MFWVIFEQQQKAWRCHKTPGYLLTQQGRSSGVSSTLRFWFIYFVCQNSNSWEKCLSEHIVISNSLFPADIGYLGFCSTSWENAFSFQDSPRKPGQADNPRFFKDGSDRWDEVKRKHQETLRKPRKTEKNTGRQPQTFQGWQRSLRQINEKTQESA